MAEYVMLHQIHYDPRDARSAPRYALGLLSHCGFQLPSERECFDAIRSLCFRQLITIVDGATRHQIRAYLKSRLGIGPTDGLPMVGETDFTLKGAELWRNMLNYGRGQHDEDHFWYQTGSFIYRKNAIVMIYHSKEWLFGDIRRCEFEPYGPCETIGRWRRQWWREIPFGFLQRCRPLIDRDR